MDFEEWLRTHQHTMAMLRTILTLLAATGSFLIWISMLKLLEML